MAIETRCPSDGVYSIVVNYEDIGFPATPRLIANGAVVSGTAATAETDRATAAFSNRDRGTRGTGQKVEITGSAHLKSGDNIIQPSETISGVYITRRQNLEIDSSGVENPILSGKA